MSTKVPIVKVKILEKLLFHLGFEARRQSGSHVFYRHPDGRWTTLPHHGNQDLGRSLIRQILREIDITPEEFIRYLKKI
ncbi:MAG: type II toxin-antitoxin system HicA family toxin [Bacteroidales bacterium]|nr:type II toxin-antitoxin system HicA family toxin [Bacteroidales bacterium]